MQRNPTFARGWTKTELANHINDLERRNKALRDAIRQFLTWYSFDFAGDNQTYQEQADEAIERLRRV